MYWLVLGLGQSVQLVYEWYLDYLSAGTIFLQYR